MKLSVHPAAKLFPLMNGDDYEQFREDIRAHGLLDPITVTSDGQVLDGRNRLRACKELNIDCPQQVADPASPVAFVISQNLHRRHLTVKQRAFAAAKTAPLLEAEARERKRAAGRAAQKKGGRGRPNRVGTGSVPTLSRDRDPGGRTSVRLGKMFDVGRTAVEHAAAVLKKKPEL